MSRYPKVGNASSTTYSTSTTSIPQPLTTTILPSRLRHEQEQHQLTVSYQSPRSTMATLPTLPPISTLPYDNFGSYKSPSSEQYRNSPSTPYSASSTTSSFSSYLPSPLPQPSTPTQIPPSHSQPSYYQHQQQQQQQQQRSPQTTNYYSQPTYSSYSQYPQQNSPTAQPSPRRTTQQLQQQHYSSQQQPSPIYPPHSSSTQSHTPIRPYQRSHTTQNVISEPFVTVTPELNNRPPRRRRRPPFSYSSLIAQAILDSPDKRLTLREVYQWIMERYPQLYKADDTGWQNTIRHNLSLNKCFKKVPRSDTELGHSTSSSAASKGKGGYWTIDPEYMSAYHDGVFARGGVQKRRPGEVGVGGIHPGMGGTVLGDDDSGGSDTSPSDNNTNMAGRLVEVEDDNESTYHHHPHHHILNHQQQYHYPSHNGSTGERIPLTLTVPPPTSSTSLMTPPLSSSLSQPKKFYVAKRHSSEPNFTNLTSPSPLNYSSNVNVNINGSNSGRCDIFNTTDVSNPSSDHSNSHIDIPPYSIESSSGPGSEWSDSSIKREIKMEIDQYYYDNHPAIGEINSSNSSVAGSMKIRNLLN